MVGLPKASIQNLLWRPREPRYRSKKLIYCLKLDSGKTLAYIVPLIVRLMKRMSKRGLRSFSPEITATAQKLGQSLMCGLYIQLEKLASNHIRRLSKSLRGKLQCHSASAY